ncbi:hypothetical protein MSAN_02063600 [Mycena sanguinolenta]|uniref:Uncharacterized protein n=1 Tax=Mycena sanguinolenta TaxID=230812 RepID=A0A8H6XJI3_9AGAR|nr:hypothetical protein MSAN_02063600 [Mycena sanguinolenta]
MCTCTSVDANVLLRRDAEAPPPAPASSMLVSASVPKRILYLGLRSPSSLRSPHPSSLILTCAVAAIAVTTTLLISAPSSRSPLHLAARCALSPIDLFRDGLHLVPLVGSFLRRPRILPCILPDPPLAISLLTSHFNRAQHLRTPARVAIVSFLDRGGPVLRVGTTRRCTPHIYDLLS